MKQVLNVGIGGRSFVIDEDAFDRLSAYLDAFRSRTGMGYQTKEVMDDLEMRIAEIFSESLSSRQEVVDISLVERVIAQLGMPDGSTPPGGTGSAGGANTGEYWHSSRESRPVRKLYRDKDHNVLGGVASGLACYFDVDVLVIRILFVCLFLFGSFGGWVYIILWIAVPAARTSAEKCRMHGLPVTAENMRRFYNSTN
ncbi:MAG TPA: PspC domain-containing protein [Candidatus Coprenecus avistercoris]|uniref:PspC domain-containing protein n=1 Tax=Candidatus Coprenecus avistercoris TaxID=2840730 RepID=A0A9D1J6H7_9BACT|nr:PspC domain-containing protein [Candidatus Coprenecus avistercoris]